MGKGNLIINSSWLLLQKITCRSSRSTATCSSRKLEATLLTKPRGFHEVCGDSSSNKRQASVLSLTEELKIGNINVRDQERKRSRVCIYKVPKTMREMKSKAYQPKIVSIGPYHHGVASLQAMEKLKRIYFWRLFKQPIHCPEEDPLIDSRDGDDNGIMMQLLDDTKKAMQKLEEVARSCYLEEFKLSSEEFVKMMLIDGCFIIGLLKDYSTHLDFEHAPSTIERWMLPILRQDLIKLENQLPLFVLRELFQIITRISSSTNYDDHQPAISLELEALALHFFDPLLRGHVDLDEPSQQSAPNEVQFQGKHFLDLFHHSIRPVNEKYCFSTLPHEEPRGKQTQLMMIPSIQEVKEAGVKFKTDISRGPLHISFRRSNFWRRKVLIIPPIKFNDHRGTLFRNMLAFEKCHQDCPQDVTAYLLFLDRLINSAKDVELLHYHKVLYHSLGSNRRVANLVNNLCKEICPDVSHSYLYKVVGDVSRYYNSPYAKSRAFLVHHHFSSWLVGISTLGACLALYLTLIQTGCTVAGAKNVLDNGVSLGSFLSHSFFLTYIFGEKDSKPS